MSDTARTFKDRREAGRVLAHDLARYRGRKDLLVLGLARGGVPIGWEIASFLHAPLDVCLVRKLGVPRWPELAMGALATGGGVVLNDDLLRSLGISEDQIRDAITRETAELHRREHAYRADRCRQLSDEADDVVCSTRPADFRAVGQVFEDFHQVSDDEVRELLATPTVEHGPVTENR